MKKTINQMVAVIPLNFPLNMNRWLSGIQRSVNSACWTPAFAGVTGVLFLIQIYQKLVSPHLGLHCRFVPTCSEYASEAIKHHGFFKGSVKALGRLLRCHPFHAGGYDPVSL
jgi:putative membrane protein insertion efficiency factor